MTGQMMRRLFGDRSGHAAPAARGRIAANAGGTWSDVRTMLKYDGNDYRLKLWISGITNCAACEVFERAWFTATARTLLGSLGTNHRSPTTHTATYDTGKR